MMNLMIWLDSPAPLSCLAHTYPENLSAMQRKFMPFGIWPTSIDIISPGYSGSGDGGWSPVLGGNGACVLHWMHSVDTSLTSSVIPDPEYPGETISIDVGQMPNGMNFLCIADRFSGYVWARQLRGAGESNQIIRFIMDSLGGLFLGVRR